MVSRLTPETLVYGLASANDPQISPDGEWIVYSLSRNDPETKKGSSQLWLCKRDGSCARQLTFAGTSNGLARWSPEGRAIAFVSNRDKEESGLFLLSLDGGDPRKLATYKLGVGEPAWSRDGSKIAFTAVIDPEHPDDEKRDDDAPEPIKVTSRIDYKQDTRGYLAEKRGQIIVHDLATGENRQLTEGGEHVAPRWSPDDKTIAAMCPIPNFVNSRLELIDVASGENRFLTIEKGIIGTWLWAQDGSGLLVTQDPEWTFQHEAWWIPVDGGDVRQVTHDSMITTSGSWSVSRGPDSPVWIDGGLALYPAASRGRSGLYAVDVETGETTEEVVWEAEHVGFSVDAHARYIVQTRSSFDATGEIVVYDRDSGTTTQITSLNTKLLDETKPGQWERFDIERNGFTIEAWLLKPADFDPSKRYPLILDIHGGPNSWYGYDFDNLREAMASAGFVVVFSNPRGSGTYGQKFTSAVQRDWGNEDYFDLMAVADHAAQLPYVDAERTGVYGYSYGGFMTSWIIGHTDRFKAAVIGAPVVDLVSFYGTSDIGHVWAPNQLGGTPWEIPDWYREHSPITHLPNAKTPSLILHSEGDVRCPIGQGEQCFTALKAAGVETEFVRYPGGDHLFVWNGYEPSYVADFLTRVVGWFEEHV